MFFKYQLFQQNSEVQPEMWSGSILCYMTPMWAGAEKVLVFTNIFIFDLKIRSIS